MPCVPPYYPCPGHESTVEHDRCAPCLYYAVWAGFVRGAYSNSWIAREQTERFTDSRQKSFKTRTEMHAWWTAMCTSHHTAGCPPFEPVTFSLVRDPLTHPSSAPCTRAAIAAPTPAPAPASSSTVAPPRIFVPSTSSSSSIVNPLPAPSPFNSPSSRATSSSSRATSASSVSPSPTPKKEEPTTPQLQVPTAHHMHCRLHLTPTGLARGNALVALSLASSTASSAAGPAGPSSSSLAIPSASSAAGPSALATPTRPSRVTPSVLVTPNPAVPPSQAPAAPLPRVRQYGIRGVAVFYNTHAAAQAAAARLGLCDSKIMFSDNPEKLEAWMAGEPFDGEDD